MHLKPIAKRLQSKNRYDRISLDIQKRRGVDMRENIFNKNGITLIALVITIIVLLILAGITIATLTGENGLFARAKEAEEKTIKGQLKEEIDMAIMDIQIDQVPKGNEVTLESLVGGQLQEKLDGITAELSNNEIIGEYKDYNYSIDENLNVTIEGKIKGIRFSYKLEPKVFTSENVKLTIDVSSSNGEITKIQAPEGLTSNGDGTYTINKNGSYEFTITDTTGGNIN